MSKYIKGENILVVKESSYIENPREYDNRGIIFAPKLAVHESEYCDNLIEELFMEACPCPMNANFNEYEYAVNKIPRQIIYKYVKKHYAILPLYYLSHGCESISTKDFNDSWDSGKCGYIYTLLKEGEKIEDVENILESEVKELDFCWNNTPLYYTLYEKIPTTDGAYTPDEIKSADYQYDGYLYKEIDSCGGFYEIEDIFLNTDMKGAKEI